MGQNWAIVIGINHYNNLQSLKYAKRDAEAMRDFFTQLPCESVFLFTEDAASIPVGNKPAIASQPTLGNLRYFLRLFSDHFHLQAGDNLWFFFSGHGFRSGERDYLMPSDGDPEDVEATGIPVSLVTERLRKCGADNVILLLDACRNGGRKAGVGIGAELQPGVVSLFSCSPNEVSYEVDALRQGAFTHALLQGLKIQGEGNCATVERLNDYLRRQVPQLVQSTVSPQCQQTPYSHVEPLSKCHLILLPRQAAMTDVAILKADALEAEAEGDLEVAEQLWVRVLFVLPGDQQAIKAIKRIAPQLITGTQASDPSVAGNILIQDKEDARLDKHSRTNAHSQLNGVSRTLQKRATEIYEAPWGHLLSYAIGSLRKLQEFSLSGLALAQGFIRAGMRLQREDWLELLSVLWIPAIGLIVIGEISMREVSVIQMYTNATNSNNSPEQRGEAVRSLVIGCSKQRMEIWSYFSERLYGNCRSLGNRNLEKVNLHSADLRFADFRSANLFNAKLFNANLGSADLHSANLGSADLRDAYLGSANFRSADLNTADLRDAYLNEADLGSANLNKADLSTADLSTADLRFADFRSANLRSAILLGVDLSQTQNLTQEQLQDSFLCKTELPSSIKLDPNRDCDRLRKMGVFYRDLID